MKVLVVGGGGREHAVVDALSRSPQVSKIYCAPGNAGIARQAECVPVKDTDVEGLLSLDREKEIDLTVVGPEAALVAGIVDRFREEGLRIFGPTKAAARIESSKEFAKDLMGRYGIPTAGYRAFDDYRPEIRWSGCGKGCRYRPDDGGGRCRVARHVAGRQVRQGTCGRGGFSDRTRIFVHVFRVGAQGAADGAGAGSQTGVRRR